MKMSVLTGILSCCLVMALAQHDHAGSTNPPENIAFDSIRNLAGEWHGSFTWKGTTRNGKMNARYYLTGNGTAVVEDLIEEGTVVMTSVYHLDGNSLRATHYCAAGNQPRLKAGPYHVEDRSVNFQFVDITNLANPDAPHVSGLQLHFVEKNKLTIIFDFTSAGKTSIEQIDLTRS